MRSFKVFILIILLGLIFPNNTFAGKQELTPENVIQVSAIGATKGEFCRLSANADEVKSFHNNILTTQYSDEKFYKLFEEIPCESETKEIIYGSLEIIRNTPDRDVLYPQVFLIDDEIIRPGGWVDFYKYESSIIDQNKVFDSMLEMNRQYHPSIHYSYKGTRAIKLWTLPIEDETKTPFYKDNTLVFEDSAVTLKSGFFVHLDESGLIDQFYIFHNNSIYRHVKSIKEIKDMLLIDYSIPKTDFLSPTPTDYKMPGWLTYTGKSGNFNFSLQFPPDVEFKKEDDLTIKLFTRRLREDETKIKILPSDLGILTITFYTNDLTKNDFLNPENSAWKFPIGDGKYAKVSKQEFQQNNVKREFIMLDYTIDPEIAPGLVVAKTHVINVYMWNDNTTKTPKITYMYPEVFDDKSSGGNQLNFMSIVSSLTFSGD